jgi:hypothetical protein
MVDQKEGVAGDGGSSNERFEAKVVGKNGDLSKEHQDEPDTH